MSTERNRIIISVAVIEFDTGGNTLWVQGHDGGTVLRLKMTGKIITEICQTSPGSHADAIASGDLKFCLGKDAL